jgi:hypothetical protein
MLGKTREELVRMLRNPSQEVALCALEVLNARGHLMDGSLERAYLRYIDIAGADLRDAQLRRADLTKAQLSGAILADANLQEACLSGADLSGASMCGADLRGARLTKVKLLGVWDLSEYHLAKASRLRGAKMPDGSVYDGRFNLEGDLKDARILHVQIDDPQAMAAFYGTSTNQYKLGQEYWQMRVPVEWGARVHSVGVGSLV